MTETPTQTPPAGPVPPAAKPATAVPAAAAPAPERDPDKAVVETGMTVKTKPGQEVWETTTNATIFLAYEDSRGRQKTRKYGGKKGDRIRIGLDEREYMEENMRDLDRSPFRTGLLKQVGGERSIDNERNTLSDEDMVMAFKTRSGATFNQWVGTLNELNLRRAEEMLEAVDATASQQRAVREALQPYRKGKDVETYREMQAQKDVASA